MPITLPNLDDRRYADLVEEARGLLVTHAPALTNHNPSDPVVTLAELFAYFTEALLFRVDSITDTERTKFLRLLNGPGWTPPATRAELDAEVGRTVLELRRADRAVTPADYESLASAADPLGQVARAHCIPERNLELADDAARRQPAPGHVSVVIVPLPGALGAELRSTVAAYLEPRRLLTARVHVVAPRLVPVRVRVTVRLSPDATDAQVRPRVLDALTRHLDAIVGSGGAGWPIGRNVNVSEIYRVLDTLPGVDYVRRTVDPDTGGELDELVTDDAFVDRLVRGGGGLIAIALEQDELPQYQPPAAGTATAGDIVIEQPFTAP